MTYKEALEFMYSQLPMFHRIGKEAYKANLDNTLAMDAYLGHPHKSFLTIHIGGTNGKGSTSHMLASIFQQAGYKTGLYTSPHLIDFRERIRINGEMIAENKVVDFLQNHKDKIEEIHPSFFEMTVALAFDYFRNEKVDIAIIEVGMGGRLDSTNIISPILSIITNISSDHKQFLGDTLPKIASEKAGIIKFKTPVIIGERDDASCDTFSTKAKNESAPIEYATDLVLVKSLTNQNDLTDPAYLINHQANSLVISCDLSGLYQEKNIQTVFAAFLQLKTRFNLSLEHFKNGLKMVKASTGLQGRWDIIRDNPLVICDTGHNEAGIHYVVNQLKHYKYNHLHLVFGAVNDKEIDRILELLPTDATYYFVKASIPRALDEQQLLEKAKSIGLDGKSFDTVEKGYAEALKESTKEDLIFVGGSTFVVADFLLSMKK